MSTVGQMNAERLASEAFFLNPASEVKDVEQLSVSTGRKIRHNHIRIQVPFISRR